MQPESKEVNVAARIAEEEEHQFLIRRAFRLIECEFSQLQQQIFRQYVLEEQQQNLLHSVFGQRWDGLRSQVKSHQSLASRTSPGFRIVRAFRGRI